MNSTGVRLRTAALLAAGAALAAAGPATGQASAERGSGPPVTVQAYDTFQDADGYTAQDYDAKWALPYGPGEMAAGGSRGYSGGVFTAAATPFTTGYDVSVYDHIKYLAVSRSAFPVPSDGSVTFSMKIAARTPGTQPGRVVQGTYTESGEPFSQTVRQGQQAAATLHMIDFATGQLFDWFVAGDTAFTLVERLPESVIRTGGGGTRDTIYTQIVDEVPLTPGPHRVSITLRRGADGVSALWHLDGELVSRVEDVGVPLDVQGVPYTGTWPSLGPGELVGDRMDSVVMGHGLFSLLDAFPFQHPDAPELHVSIPLEQRLFGQGASATFDDAYVVTVGR